MLESFKKNHPNGRFIIKADGTDLVPCVQESMKNKWNGDVDLGDGKLEKLRAEYDRLRKLALDGDLDILDAELIDQKSWLRKESTSIKAKIKKAKPSTETDSSTESKHKLEWRVSVPINFEKI